MKLFYFLILFSSLLVLSCKKTKIDNKVTIEVLSKNYFEEKNKLNPLEATQNGQFQYNDTIAFEMTLAYKNKKKAFIQTFEKELSSIDKNVLNEEEKVSYDIIDWELKIEKELENSPMEYIPFNQFWGKHLTMAQMASGENAQPFQTIKDYQSFGKRMILFANWLDSAQIAMRKGIQKNIVLPEALVKKIIPQFTSIQTTNIEDNLYFSSIKKIPPTLSSTSKDSIALYYKGIIEDKLMPAYHSMSIFLENEYLPKARKSSGIDKIPNGDKIYKTLVKQWTTTNLSPQDIHEIGLKEVQRIRKEMEKIKKQVGFAGSLRYFFDFVRNKKELKPFTRPEQVINNFNSIYEKIKPNVDLLFSLLPKTPFEVRRTEAFREKTASAGYSQGAADGSRPGIFYVPIPDVLNYNYYGDEDLFLHEAIPGHHFQIALQQENQKLPDFRKYNWFGAYGEGWALYCESLGKELGLYTDPYQYFGMLGNEIHRAIRLVVDTGLHTKGWTREQAIAYSLENEAESPESIEAEIERYMAIPGQALSYKIGQMKILELRNKAQDKLNNKFDIKIFHQKVLESGVMPLALLENKIDNWIK